MTLGKVFWFHRVAVRRPNDQPGCGYSKHPKDLALRNVATLFEHSGAPYQTDSMTLIPDALLASEAEKDPQTTTVETSGHRENSDPYYWSPMYEARAESDFLLGLENLNHLDLAAEPFLDDGSGSATSSRKSGNSSQSKTPPGAHANGHPFQIGQNPLTKVHSVLRNSQSSLRRSGIPGSRTDESGTGATPHSVRFVIGHDESSSKLAEQQPLLNHPPSIAERQSSNRSSDPSSVFDWFNPPGSEFIPLSPSPSQRTLGQPIHPNLFVELYELNVEEGKDGTVSEPTWQETARWIKYEEDAVGVDHHFGRPHVAFLSFHSLMQLRRLIYRGIILLDAEEQSYFQVSEKVAESIATTTDGTLDEAEKEQLLKMMVLSHKHAHHHKFHLMPKAFTHHHGFGTSSAHLSSTLGGNASSDGRKSDLNSKASAPGFLTSRLATDPSSGLSQSASATNVRRQKPPSFDYDKINATSTPVDTVPGDGGPDELKTEHNNNGSALDGSAVSNRQDSTDRKHSTSTAAPNGKLHLHPPGGHKISFSKPSFSAVSQFLRRQQSHGALPVSTDSLSNRHNSYEDLMKKIPSGAESAQVFVGVLPNFNKIRLAFVRLKHAVPMPDILNAPISIRFLFFLIGTPFPDLDYHEIGRSIATLMSNPDFYEQAYSAQNTMDILHAVDDFLDASVVIPSGEIDSRGLLSVADVQKALTKRKRNIQELAAAEIKKESDAGIVIQASSPKVGFAEDQKPPKKPYDPLTRTGRPFYGLLQEAKRRFPLYVSDFFDACHFQCFTALFFMFFAAFAPAIAFGGLLSSKTNDLMGVSEVLMAQFLCGMVWGFTSCQPLLVMAATGPIMIFEGSLFKFCESQSLEFLVVRFWTAFWVLIITIVVVMLEGSYLVRAVTRFTEDIFASLISFIFVYESIKFLLKNFTHYHPVHNLAWYCSHSVFGASPGADNFTLAEEALANGSFSYNETFNPLAENAHKYFVQKNQPDTALLSACYLIATFTLSYWLKTIRTSHYFSRKIRTAIGDFGVPIAILIVGLLDMLAFKEPYLERLHMPGEFGLTAPDKRGWWVHPMGTTRSLPVWVIFAAVIPGFLVFILLFVETEITQLLLAKPERGLRKGTGFHWDMLLVGVLTLMCSFLGLPWMCAAAVQSLAHASSLTVFKRHAPGERVKVDYVIEQRVTTLGVSLLTGGAMFLGFVLQQIPLAVLFGVFMYLGIMNITCLQFLHRLILIIIPTKYYPEFAFCQNVSLKKMHLFTMIQLLCFIVVWILKTFPSSALVFPFALLLIGIGRLYLLPFIFTHHELEALDGEEEQEDTKRFDPYKDFYELARGIGT